VSRRMPTKTFSAISFRDPAGFVYSDTGEIRRQINEIYARTYDHLLSSGLYDELTGSELLIRHEEIEVAFPEAGNAYKVIRPVRIPLISYPYEWCFSQLKDAALLTLEIQQRALARGMSLKDSSAFNVQFLNGRPIFIDTLSFELLQPGQPWVAYRQFCQHFLAPLALMSLSDVRLNQLTRVNLDGIPLDLVGRLLPWKSRFRWGVWLHLLLHGRFNSAEPTESRRAAIPAHAMSNNAQLGLLESLASTVRSLQSPADKGVWANYYADNTYSPDELQHKEKLVSEFLETANASTAWDLGANTGRFSRLTSDRGIATISFDSDHTCIEENYVDAKRTGATRILPLLFDLFNPSPALGWMTEERDSIFNRANADVVIALALIHHLAVVGNQPLPNLATLFQRLSPWLIIEFVPETDPQFLRLIRQRQGIHHEYHRTRFEQCFSQHFQILRTEPVTQSGRILYLMRRTTEKV
jgi:hypothetical protein